MKRENKIYVMGTVDIDGFHHFVTKEKEDIEMFSFLERFYLSVEKNLRHCNGRVVKCIGDCVMFVADSEVRPELKEALKQAHDQIESEVKQESEALCITMKIHFGSVIEGMLGPSEEQRLDIVGRAVNDLFLLKGSGFVLSKAFKEKVGKQIN